MPILFGNTASSGLANSVVVGAYDSIATVTVGAGGSSTISFTSIPSTYTHLQVRAIAKVGTATNMRFKFNSDAGTTTYSYHYLYGDGATPTAGGGSGTFGPGYVGYLSSNAQFGALTIDVLDYANTNKYKVARSLLGVDANGSGSVIFSSSLWLNTAAISTIDIYAAYNFAEYSSFALYGIKGA